MNQFNVIPLMDDGAVRVVTAVPLDDPEISNRHLVRDMGRDEAVGMATAILAAAGVLDDVEVTAHEIVYTVRVMS